MIGQRYTMKLLSNKAISRFERIPMKRDYLGDSYDAVKRLWQQVFADWAPLYADLWFIPEDLRGEFTRLTGISMLPDSPQQPYSILNDPDTGIRLPGENNQKESRAHIALLGALHFCNVSEQLEIDQENGLAMANCGKRKAPRRCCGRRFERLRPSGFSRSVGGDR